MRLLGRDHREHPIQTKLAVNTPGDQYEQEADRVAEQGMRKPELELQRACTDQERLQMRPLDASSSGQVEASPITHEVLASSGQPLDAATRSLMEPRFGHDFGRVRVHSDSEAADSARALGALAYTVGTHVVFGAGQHTGTREGRRLLAHELTHVVQQNRPGAWQPSDSQEREAKTAAHLADSASIIPVGFASAPGVIQRAPDTKKTSAQPSSPKLVKPKHSLKVQIRIADDIVVVEEEGKRRHAGLFATMPKELSKRLIGQVKERLSFVNDEGFQLSVEFGQFKPSDLKVAGNIQVWLVDELDQSVKPGDIMKRLYGYKAAAAKHANEQFTDVTASGPGQEFKFVGGITPDQTSDDVPGTAEPVFIKIPQLFSRDELSHFKEGKKEEAFFAIDEISATISHEIGHVLRSEPDAGHAKGTFNQSRQSFPPRLMDVKSARNPWQVDKGSVVPRFANEKNDLIEKEEIDELGGWPYVWDVLVIPNVGDDKVIRYAKVTPDGGMIVYYNFKNLGYAEDEKGNMIEFLKGIEMSQANNKWKKKN